MSSAGQALGGVAGAVIGFFVSGGTPQGALYGAQIGMSVGGLLDPPKGPHTEGPRLSDLSVQTSTYGAVIPRVYGTVAIYGNVFWLENNKLKEVATKKKKGGKGGGGGATSTTYTYFATFAVGLCKGPIAGVRRIWVGSKLIYDAGSSDIGAIIASNESSGLFTLHNGSDTQMPDARMQATLGVANTPGYRGEAYLVFNDLPLADHGNSLLGAPIKAEVVTQQTGAAPALVSLVTLPGAWPGGALYGATALHMAEDSQLDIFHTTEWYTSSTPTKYSKAYPTGDRQEIGSVANLSQQHIGGWSDVPVWARHNTAGTSLLVYGETGVEVLNSAGIPGTSGAQTLKFFQRGDERILCAEYSTVTSVWDVSDPTAVQLFSTTSASTYGRLHTIFLGDAFNYSISNSTAPYFVCYDKSWAPLWSVSIPVSLLTFDYGIGGGNVVIREEQPGQCVLKNSIRFIRVNEDGYSNLGNTTGGLPVGYEESGGHHLLGNLWITYIANFNQIAVVRLEPSAPTLPTLSSIVQAECLASNLLTAGDLDTSALTQSVRGYRVASVAAIRSALEPLQGAWPFDVVQHGYQIKFKPRGSASVATIPAADLDARGAGDQPGVAITNTREMDSVLPARVSIKHLDVSREYDTGEQYAERLNTEAVNVRDMDLAIVMTSGEAAGTAEMLLYLYWMERYDLSFRLPPTYNQLEPGDTITVNATEATYILRLTAITYTQDGRLECTAKYNSAALYTPAALGEVGQSTGSTLTLPGATRYELLDVPLLLDSTDLPGFPVAMAGYLTGWPGGVLMRSDDAGQTWDSLQGFTAPGAEIGYASNSIGAGRTELLDKSSALAVVMPGADLESVSELILFGGSNHFAYGVHGRWEIIGAQNCTLQGDGSYILTDLLRGRQGSEWACGLHVAGDKIILLDSARLQFIAATLDSIGQSRTYRGVTSGKTLDSASDYAFAYAGVNLECLAPVYLNGNRHPSTNDWSLVWIRRTRVGGAWRDYVDASLGEATEAYEVDIFSSNTYVTLKRTLTGLATPAAAYTSAQQVTDFGSNQSTLYVKVYQISANVGRGYPLTTSITR